MGGRTTVVVGHYKRASRTSRAARHLGSMLANDSAPSVIELADHRDVLLSDPGNPGLVSVKEEVARSSVVVIASPTYKGTYTGILKLFLEQFPGGSGLEG